MVAKKDKVHEEWKIILTENTNINSTHGDKCARLSKPDCRVWNFGANIQLQVSSTIWDSEEDLDDLDFGKGIVMQTKIVSHVIGY